MTLNRIKSLISLLILVFPLVVHAQNGEIKLSGKLLDQSSQEPVSYANVLLKSLPDTAFVTGAISDAEGYFTLQGLEPGEYNLEIAILGYDHSSQKVYIGGSSVFLHLGEIYISPSLTDLEAVEVLGQEEGVNAKMDVKSFDLGDNISQRGGSILEAIQNLPGVSVQEGKVNIRGNDRVAILMDGKQTALTGFGDQNGLNNLPASSVERIEIINNPSSRYDANGNGGIINIILKKEKQQGFNGSVGMALGAGAIWEKKANLPGVRPQYSITPKINPSLALNYRKEKLNFFFSGDNLYTENLNKNEFVTRTYEDGAVIKQQLKRNRDTNFLTLRTGMDWSIDARNTLTISGLYGSEKIIDNGDQIFYNEDFSERLRLWQFLEDELKTTVMGSVSWEHEYKEPGHKVVSGVNYTFHREDEQYFFTNSLPEFVGEDAFKLLSDENVIDFNLDYSRPLKMGRLEAGMKLRRRWIPTDMQFFPGDNSPIDSLAGGWATYKETIPAVYGNYIYESKKWEAEIGLRVEYANLRYEVNPDHPTYKTDGYDYFQPFPNTRLSHKLNAQNKLTLSFNRRVDRPNEVDIRIFPKYDDAEIIKVGNPELKPQFSRLFEFGWKNTYKSGSFYLAAYHRKTSGTITRISTVFGESRLIYAIFQNAGDSYNTGMEALLEMDVSDWYAFDININGYQNQINAFTVQNLYPEPHEYYMEQQKMFSGNAKWNSQIKFSNTFSGQLTAIYLAPDIIPQGEIKGRFTMDMGLKKLVQKGAGEVYFNASDLLNTMVIKKDIEGNGFSYISDDYYETQVLRLGYTYKF